MDLKPKHKKDASERPTHTFVRMRGEVASNYSELEGYVTLKLETRQLEDYERNLLKDLFPDFCEQVSELLAKQAVLSSIVTNEDWIDHLTQ